MSIVGGKGWGGEAHEGQLQWLGTPSLPSLDYLLDYVV